MVRLCASTLVPALLTSASLRFATADVLRINFGPPETDVGLGYEGSSPATGFTPFVQWSKKVPPSYWGSCYGAYWGGLDSAVVSHIEREATPLGTSSVFPLGTFLCLIGVPIGSFSVEVTVGDSVAPTSSCFELLSGDVLYDNATNAGEYSTGKALVLKQSADDCLRIRSCRAASTINTMEVQSISCHASCAFCTGAGASECALRCNDGRTYLEQEGGGAVCEARAPYAPGEPPTISALTNRSLELSWLAPVSGGEPVSGYVILASEGSDGAPFQELLADTASPEPWASLTGLAGDTLYSFVVLAVSAAGRGEPSPSSAPVRTLPLLPAAPAAPEVLAVGQTSLRVAWQAPYNGGSPIIAYFISAVPHGSTGLDVSIVRLTLDVNAVNGSQVNISGLQGFSTYVVQAQAVNGVGPGPASPASQPVRTLAVPPEPPHTLSVSEIEQHALHLSWDPPVFDGGSNITGYQVFCRSVTEPLRAVTLDLPVKDDAYAVRLDGLAGYTLYSCQVSAVNVVGMGSYSVESAVARTLPVTPSAPRAPVATDIHAHHLTLSWTEPETDVGHDPTSYRVWYRSNPADVWMVFCNDTATNETSRVLEGLEAYQSFLFAVSAINPLGVGQRSPSSATVFTAWPGRPHPPAAPELLNITASSVRATWTAPRSGGTTIIGYSVELAKGPNETFDWALNTSARECELTGLSASSLYSVRIVALSNGTPSLPGAASETETLSPVPPGSPQDLNLTIDAPHTARLTWESPEDDGGRPVEAFLVSASEATGTVVVERVLLSGEVEQRVAEVTGLLGGVDYAFQVQAMNEAGSSTASHVFGTTPAPTLAARPATPLPLSVEQHSVLLSWGTPQHDGGSHLTGFSIAVEDVASGTMLRIVEVPGALLSLTTVGGLPGNTEHSFRVAAVNAVGRGPWSEASSPVRTRPVPPSPPGKPWAEEVQQYWLQLRWTAPTGDGGLDITGYQVWLRAGSSSTLTLEVNDTGSNDSSHLVTTEGNTAYSFVVAGINAVGTGGRSLPSDTVKTLPVPPAQPPAPGILSTGPSWIQLVWPTTLDDGGSSIIAYVVEASDAVGGFTGVLNTSDVTCRLTGLLGSTTYEARLIAVNAVGESVPGAAVRFTTRPPVAPAPPRSVVAAFLGPSVAQVTWQPPADNGGRPVLSYLLSVFPVDNSSETDFFFRKEVGASSVGGLHLAYVHGTLGSTTYAFHVWAITTVDSSPESTELGTTPAAVVAAAPGVPLVVAIYQRSVEIAWSASEHDGGSRITGYRLWVEVKDEWSFHSTLPGSGELNGTTLHGLTEFTAYRFRVQVLNGVGASAFSEASAAIRTLPAPPSAPGSPRFGEVGQSWLQLLWDPPERDGGSEILGYIIWQRRTEALDSDDWSVACNSTESNESSMLVTGLSGNTAYSFAVAAVNTLGIGARSAVVSQRTAPIPPAPPGAPLALRAGAQWAKLTWTAPLHDGGSPVDSYELALKTGAGSVWAAVEDADPGNRTSFVLSGLSGNASFAFSVRASNAAGFSPWSHASTPDATLVTVPPPPSPCKVLLMLEPERQNLAVSWEAPLLSGIGQSISHYTVSLLVETATGSRLSQDAAISASQSFWQLPISVDAAESVLCLRAVSKAGVSACALVANGTADGCAGDDSSPASMNTTTEPSTTETTAEATDSPSVWLNLTTAEENVTEWDSAQTAATTWQRLADTWWGYLPGAPSEPTARSTDSGTIWLQWLPPRDQGHSAVTHYSIWVRSLVVVEPFAVATNVSQAPGAHARTAALWTVVDGLQPRSLYSFRIQAVNDVGAGELSPALGPVYTGNHGVTANGSSENSSNQEAGEASLPGRVTVCGAPEFFVSTLSDVTAGTLVIRWTPPACHPILGYRLWVQRGTLGKLELSTYNIPGNATETLAEGHGMVMQVAFQIQAVSTEGPGMLSMPAYPLTQSVASAPKPGQPLLGTLMPGQHVVISWTGIEGASDYRLLRRDGFWSGTEGFYIDLTSTGGSVIAVSGSLLPGVQHEFAVQALLPSGIWSLPSEASRPLPPTTAWLPSCPGHLNCGVANGLCLLPGGDPHCARLDDGGCPGGSALDELSGLCVVECPIERLWKSKNPDGVTACGTQCPNDWVAASGNMCADECPDPKSILVLQAEQNTLACSAGEATSHPVLELRFDLGLAHVEAALATRVLTGVATATGEPFTRFGYGGLSL